MGRGAEDFELLNTASMLRRAAWHCFVFYHGAIPEAECFEVVRESYGLLTKTARIKYHLVPLAERWSLDRLRRVGRLSHRLAHTVPEVLFVDRSDTVAAPIAAALLAGYARGRVNVSSAGVLPGEAVRPETVRVLDEVDIDARAAFPKPLTGDAVEGADLIVLLGIRAEPAPGADRISGLEEAVRWSIPDLEDVGYQQLQLGRDELDRRVLRLLADVLSRVVPD
jgi:protein-tyrosine-phosphatase